MKKILFFILGIIVMPLRAAALVAALTLRLTAAIIINIVNVQLPYIDYNGFGKEFLK